MSREFCGYNPTRLEPVWDFPIHYCCRCHCEIYDNDIFYGSRDDGYHCEDCEWDIQHFHDNDDDN